MVFFILSSRSTRPGPILKIPANNFHEIVDAGDKTLAQNCDFYEKCKIFNFFVIKNDKISCILKHHKHVLLMFFHKNNTNIKIFMRKRIRNEWKYA